MFGEETRRGLLHGNAVGDKATAGAPGEGGEGGRGVSPQAFTTCLQLGEEGGEGGCGVGKSKIDSVVNTLSIAKTAGF